MGRVDFFIAGTQKAGTTALDAFLRGHPRIQMAKVKEAHFFDDESIGWSPADYSPLHDQLDWRAPGVIRGEATPIYTYWPNALERLRAYNPAAKIIVLLRHPSFRAHSHWRMEATRKSETLPFSEAIRPAARQRVAEAPGGVHRVFSYVERGFYAGQARRLLALFPRASILFLRTDRFWTDALGTLNRVEAFLGVTPRAHHQASYITPEPAWREAAMSAQDRQYLDAMLADDIRQAALLTGLDLADWLRADYSEPMQPTEPRRA